jgi:hypothetical protein
MSGAAIIVQGDALHLPLPDESVDAVISSPPFYGLRAYGAGPGEMGSEATPQAFLEALWAATAEMMRVLKPTGSIFIDLGDTYSRPGGGADKSPRSLPGAGRGATARRSSPTTRVPEKSLMLLPERYRVGCVDRLGLIARAVIIHDKPNGLPESVRDRVRRSHEDWAHLVKQPRYYAALDELRAPHSPVSIARSGRNRFAVDQSQNGVGSPNTVSPDQACHPLGALPGSVWRIASEPLTLPAHLGVNHYAAFGTEWPRRLVLAFSPPGICVECGQGRVPVVETDWSQIPHEMVDKRVHTPAERARFGELFRDWQAAKGLTGREIAELFPSRTGGLTGCVANWRSGDVMTAEQVAKIEARFGALPVELVELVNLTRRVPVASFKVGVVDGAMRHRNKEPATRPDGYRSILGYACSCAPFTDHPGSGESSGLGHNRPDSGIDRGDGYANVGAGWGGKSGYSDRPKVGPWREYHLDRWTPPPTRPAVILDPFAGTGTVPMVARALGRIGVGVDLKHDYARAARWRVFSSGDWQDVIARTTGRRVKPLPKQHPGQTALDLTGGSLLADAANYRAEMEMWRDRIATIEGEEGE